MAIMNSTNLNMDMFVSLQYADLLIYLQVYAQECIIMDYMTFHKQYHEVKAAFSNGSVEPSHSKHMILICFTYSVENLNVPWTSMENYKT